MLLKNKKGITLVEIVIASGLLGLVSMGVMQLNQSMMKGQATAEVKFEGIELKRQVLMTLSDKQACENSLMGVSLGSNISSIKNSNNTIVYEVGRKYGSNTLLLKSILVKDGSDLGSGMREAQLLLEFEKLKKSTYGSKIRTYTSSLKVKAASGTSPITECYDDTNNIIATAIEEACLSLGGSWDSLLKKCSINCGPGEVIQATEKGSLTCVSAGEISCLSLGGNWNNTLSKCNLKCALGEALQETKDGTLVCVSVGVPAGAVMAFNSSNCPSGWSEYTPAYGRFVRGIDKSGSSIDPDGQRSPGDIKDDLIKNHKHDTTSYYNTCDSVDDGKNDKSGFCRKSKRTTKTYTSTNPNSGGGSETRPKNVALLYCIKN